MWLHQQPQQGDKMTLPERWIQLMDRHKDLQPIFDMAKDSAVHRGIGFDQALGMAIKYYEDSEDFFERVGDLVAADELQKADRLAESIEDIYSGG